MTDDDLVIRKNPPKKPINWDRWLSGAALLISGGAAIFSGLQYRAANRQATAAENQVTITSQAAKDQASDVERSRKAAEASAEAAKALADGMKRSASAAETSAKAGNEALRLSRQAMLLNEQPVLETLNAQLLKPLAAGYNPISVHTINSGKGPATNIDIVQGVAASATWQFPFDSANDKGTRRQTLGTNTGFSSPRITTTKSIVLTAQHVEQINAATINLYVYGTVQYERPGIDRPVHESYSFCLFYVPALDKIQTSFADCPEHPPLPK